MCQAVFVLGSHFCYCVFSGKLRFRRRGDMCTRVRTLIAELGHKHGLPCLAIQCVRLSKIGQITFRGLVALKTSVPFTCRFVACSSRIKVDRLTDTHTQTGKQSIHYCHPRACAQRVLTKQMMI